MLDLSGLLTFPLTSVTGADGEQQSELCQARMDLRNQRTAKDAALSTLHCCPLNSTLCLHTRVWADTLALRNLNKTHWWKVIDTRGVFFFQIHHLHNSNKAFINSFTLILYLLFMKCLQSYDLFHHRSFSDFSPFDQVGGGQGIFKLCLLRLMLVLDLNLLLSFYLRLVCSLLGQKATSSSPCSAQSLWFYGQSRHSQDCLASCAAVYRCSPWIPQAPSGNELSPFADCQQHW